MNRSRYENQRSKRSRDSLERRMDKFVESGRQFVDGVAGNRPGQRRKDTRNSMSQMSRWMGEKIDWFFEEEDEWNENIDSQIDIEENIPIKKIPLTAISLRVPKAIASSEQNNDLPRDQWPDEESFRVERWEREDSKSPNSKQLSDAHLYENQGEPRRPLPKSSRRRN